MPNQTNSPLNLWSNTDSNNEPSIKYDVKIVSGTKEVQSLFGRTKFLPYPGKPDENGNPTLNNYADGYQAYQDISISDLVKKTLGKPYQLTYADFAYLKNVGVYPNNRLVIARRYATPIGNDLNALEALQSKDGLNGETLKPLSTLISWFPETENFLELKFGEIWTDAEGSFENVLNAAGGDLALSSDNRKGMGQLGTIASQAFSGVALPGITELLQNEVAKSLGLRDADTSGYALPTGDPNLIKEAKRRKTIKKGEDGSGLKASISIKMVVEYEQKYIDGVDPTLVYMDIVANILSFGTSKARFMWNDNFATKSNSLLQKMISGDINGLYESLKEAVKVIKNKLNEIVDKIGTNLQSIFTTSGKKADNNIQASASEIPGFISFIAKSIGAIIGKYKVAIIGVINALTGSPSGYFHVQIGNPLRPIFSSGDMIVEEVTLTLGPVLSWNDLPSYIKAEFTLTNARSLGADELYARFNNSMARSYVRGDDFNQVNAPSSWQDEKGTTVQTNNDSQNKILQSNQNKTLLTPQGPAKVSPSYTQRGPYTGIPGSDF